MIRHLMPHQVKGSISASKTKVTLEDRSLRLPETTERGSFNKKIKMTQTSRPSNTRPSHLIVPVSFQIAKDSTAEDLSVPTWSINIITLTLMSQRKKRLKFRLLMKTTWRALKNYMVKMTSHMSSSRPQSFLKAFQTKNLKSKSTMITSSKLPQITRKNRSHSLREMSLNR
jgi:hypothetical protein